MPIKRTKLLPRSKNTLQLTEYQECSLLVDYLNLLKQQGKVVAFTHVPNETYTTSWSQKRKNKAMGVSSGFPDYIILTNHKILFIEMKRVTGGKLSEEQADWLMKLNMYNDAETGVCRGYDEAKKFIDLML